MTAPKALSAERFLPRIGPFRGIGSGVLDPAGKVAPGRPGRSITIADLAATWLFAVEGSIVARHHLGIAIGVVGMGLLTALGGGLVRDLLLGCPLALSRPSAPYPLVGFAGAGLVVVAGDVADQIPPVALQVTDAAALALFAVLGATKAADLDVAAPVAALLGACTAVGGGVIRDMILNVAPALLRGDAGPYAAFAGAAVTAVARRVTDRAPAMAVGFAVCLGLRLVSLWQGWTLPHP